MMKKCVCCGSLKFKKFSIHNYKLSRCVNCNYVFKDPSPEPENDENLLIDSSGFYLNDNNLKKIKNDIKILKGRVKYISSKTNLNKSAKILDISCGTGSFVYAARKCGFNAYGTEISNDMLNFSKKHFGNYFYHGNSSVYKNTKYDLITLFHVLEHIVNPKIFLKSEILPLLDKNGYIIIEIPNFFSFDHFLKKEKWPGLSLNVHHNFLSNESMYYLCKNLNVDIVDIEYSVSDFIDKNFENYIKKIIKLDSNYYKSFVKNFTGLVSVYYLKKNF